MERHQFTLLHDIEDSWWYRGRAAVIAGILQRLPRAARALDFGAGFGGMFSTLSRFSARVDAFEPDPLASTGLRRRGYTQAYPTTEAALAEHYDLIGLFDVIEHIERDVDFLTQLKNSLTGQGSLVLTVPAYPWLWGPLDVASHHFRRYTKSSLRKAVEAAGYQVEFVSYWNFFLFPAAATIRLLGSVGEAGLGLPGPLNALFLGLVRLEAFLMRLFPLPFGLSLIMLASPKR